MKFGVCCIVLGLEENEPPLKFQTMTYSRFSALDREEAILVLGSRILNNMRTTLASIRFCSERGYGYRLSSDLFPLITYDRANVGLEDLPQKSLIYQTMSDIKSEMSDVRVSTHPDQFNVLASENNESLSRTMKELNFQSWFMDQIGCHADYRSPINLHINNNKGRPEEIVERLVKNIEMLDPNCRSRIVFENDDKPAGWSVRKLLLHYYSRTGKPITFDYLHHKCHPDGLTEEEALRLSHKTWEGFTPLFHLSESRDEKNVRAHSDYVTKSPETYELDFDLDFEFKMKDKAIMLYESNLASTAARLATSRAKPCLASA
jgi:UV DNA damage endonuclease